MPKSEPNTTIGVRTLISQFSDYTSRPSLRIKKSDKIIKIVDKLDKLGLSTLQESDLIKTFKIISGISNYARYFLIYLLELEIYCQDKFQKLSLWFNWIFC